MLITQINTYTYSLKIANEYNKPLFNSITKVLNNAFYDSEKECIFFTAEEIVSLNDYLKMNDYKIDHYKCIKMIDKLTKQINILKNSGYCFYGFDIGDILIVDDTFIFANSVHLLPIVNDCVTFYSPIKMPYFGSPELFELTKLPSSIDYRSCYYSLGVLVVFCLLNNYLLVANEIKNEESIENILYPLYNTKIYWFLKRCFEKNGIKRILLLI